MWSDGRAAWSQEIHACTPSISGAYIFAIPLLFTVEMWWTDEYIDHWKRIAVVGLAFAANFGLSWVAGFRRDSSLFGNVEEAIEAIAVSMLLVQAVPLSIGASVANAVFDRPGNRRGHNDNPNQHLPIWKELLSGVGATMIGGVFIGFSIAPAAEVPMLAAALDHPHLLALAALACVVSVVVVPVVLYLFDRITLGHPLQSAVQQALMLAVPTTVSGAAERSVV